MYSKLVLHDKLIYEISSKLKLSKEHSVVDTDYYIIGLEPAKSHLVVKNGNQVSFELYKTGKKMQKKNNNFHRLNR